MEDFVESPTPKKPIIATVAPSLETEQDVYEEDACSICLEPFSSGDPATVTSCKHEYHLQCILEWSQRSKECPICWQLLVLKDPSCQELLLAVEIERNSRSRHRASNSNTPVFARIPPEDFDFDHVSHYADDSDFDEHIMQQLTAAALGRTRHYNRRQRQRSSGMGPSQFLVFAGPSSEYDGHQVYTTTPVESQSSSSSASPENYPSAAAISSERHDTPESNVLTSHATTISSTITDNRHGSSRNGDRVNQSSPGSPRRSRPSELLSFSESLKSKFSAASAKYKESISKSTRGLKEKLLARNNSVKELSKEVQREVTAGIAGVARMMERLDPTSKRTGDSDPVSSDAVGTSHISHNGKVVPDNLIIQSPNSIDVETARGTCSNAPVVIPTIPAPTRVEVTRVQDIL